MRWIILDTETTGLEPSQGHRVIEIGAVELENRNVTGRHFHVYLNPDRDSDPGALAVHGLTTEFLSDKPRFEDVVQDFVDYIAGGELIIHNASFDTRFLDAELARVGRPPLAQLCTAITDSLMVAREMHPGKRNSLDSLCERYGISNAHRTLHGALLDSQLLAEVWLAMTRGQDGLLIDAPEPARGAGDGLVVGGFDASALKVLRASEAEMAAHGDYLDALDKAAGGPCLWRKLDTAAAPAEGTTA
ncbi:DNA polymerase III epsilon subunit [plant metagenome]|uniref:DNA polymerase III subunit epsilon n=1 Tax=plant metagenome TaxID=1297885 RepID=A0A484P1C6_9ZZZZ